MKQREALGHLEVLVIKMIIVIGLSVTFILVLLTYVANTGITWVKEQVARIYRGLKNAE